ncbi:oxygenase MpaB family protein [Nocardia alba]|uniref:oxygenase MpaB family protein n=1 Tax=Nocardia alba TaxID=225051 RepID=UPI001FB52991|nr:oxygenase MpaB family protein [Nocardia alba]
MAAVSGRVTAGDRGEVLRCRYGTVDDFDIERFLDGIGAFAGAGANVIVQLANRPVGYGVVESTVESGRADVHPWKRLRTTLTYIAVAMLGTEDDRNVYREAVGSVHRRVRSSPGAEVKYNAFDPELQKWVAVCLCWGVMDIHERLYGSLDKDTKEVFVQYGARFGTGLQMRPDMWPADLAEFESYFEAGLASMRIDDVVAEYLRKLVGMRNVPRPRRVADFHRFAVTGLLPESMRAQLYLPWTDEQERRHRLTFRVLGAIYGRLPVRARILPYSTMLWDMRRRGRLGRPLV